MGDELHIRVEFLNRGSVTVQNIKAALDLPYQWQEEVDPLLIKRLEPDERAPVDIIARPPADIAVGNVIGSNIFNVAAILGTASVVSPLAIPSHVLTRELAVVVAMSLLLFPILRTRWRIRRWEGAVLLACYVGAVTWLL